MMFALAFEEPWETVSWRVAFLGVFASIDEAMQVKDADAIAVVEPDGLRLVRQRGRDGRWYERDELITGGND